MLYRTYFNSECPLNYRIATVQLSDDINVVEIGYNRTPKGISQIMKRDVYILHYIVKGSGEFCGEKFTANDCYIVVPHELETIVSDKEDPYEAYWVVFKGEKVLNLLKKCNLPCHNGVFKFNRVNECSKILHNALFDVEPENEFEEASVMNAAFYQILALHFGDIGPTASYSVAKKMKRFIRENYYNDITINSIAKSLGYTRNYLYTLFKNTYGISPQTYLLDLRIQKAKELLITERYLSINEISQAVGYSDSHYFSRVFHKKTGVSPKDFVKTYK